MRSRSAFRQNGHVSWWKRQRAEQRPQIRMRSAAGVMTAKSGSPAQSGQVPRVQPARSLFAMMASAERVRNGRIACTNTASSPAASGWMGGAPLSPRRTRSAPPAAGARRRGRAHRRVGSRLPRAPRDFAWRRRSRAAETGDLPSRAAAARTAGSAADASCALRKSVSSRMDGSETRDCTRRLQAGAAQSEGRAADARSGCSCFKRRSSAISRDSDRCGGVGVLGSAHAEILHQRAVTSSAASLTCARPLSFTTGVFRLA